MAGFSTQLYHLGGSPKLSNNPERVMCFFCGVGGIEAALLEATRILSINAVEKTIVTTSFIFLIAIQSLLDDDLFKDFLDTFVRSAVEILLALPLY
jgi:hypothetical protein